MWLVAIQQANNAIASEQSIFRQNHDYKSRFHVVLNSLVHAFLD